MVPAPKSRLLSHALVALIAAGVSWDLCSMTRPVADRPQAGASKTTSTSGTDASPDDTTDSLRPARSGIRPATEKPAPARRVILQGDGSLVVPPELRERIKIELSGSDGGFNREELTRLGFSDDESNALIANGEEMKTADHAREAANVVVVEKTDTKVLVKVPAVEGDKKAATASLLQKYQAIAGDRSVLAGTQLEEIAEKITDEYGGWYTVIARKEQGEDGYFSYASYRVRPGRDEDINLETSAEELKNRARGGFASSWQRGLDKEFEYLFSK